MRRFERIEEQILATVVAATLAEDPDNPYPLGVAFMSDCKNGNAMQKAFRRHMAAQREWNKARTELRRIKAECPVPQQAQPAQVTQPPIKSATTAAPPPMPVQPHRKNGEGKGWLGSEPPEWRL
jgi:hypothetical protein